MSYLDRVRECSVFDPARYRPFRVAGTQVGRVAHGFAGRLDAFADVFRVTDAAVDLAPDLTGFEQRTEAVDGVLLRLAEAGEISGWPWIPNIIDMLGP